MTLEECTALLTPFALAMRADMDQPTFRAYHRMLQDVPLALAEPALEALSRTGLTFFPTAPEIQAAAERYRRQQLALNPWTGCADCEDQRGYQTVLTDGGQKTVSPCPCKARHQSRLAERGLLEPLALLPGEGGALDPTTYPDIQQLPAVHQQRLTQIASSKVMR